jgi:hypothetical protein
VDIPLLAAAWTAQTPDASVDPEIAVPASFDDRRAGRDTEMEAVRRLIRARSAAVASDDDDDDARGHR